MRSLIGYAVSGIAVLIAILFVVFGFSYTVDQQERGVLLRNGAVVGVAQPGRGYKLPIIDSVSYVPVNQQVTHWGDKQSLQAYSQDQQPATMAVSVLWHIPSDKVAEVYSEYGSADALESRLIARKVPQGLKTIFGKFTALTAIQDRARLNAEVATEITRDIAGPVVIDGVQIENIDFSDAYENSVEARMLAEVEVQKLRQNAEREKVQAQITVTQAQAQADAKLAAAKAAALATKLAGEAEAEAIKARGDALQANPGLVALTAAEKWDGKLPTTMVPGSSVPFIGVK